MRNDMKGKKITSSQREVRVTEGKITVNQERMS